MDREIEVITHQSAFDFESIHLDDPTPLTGSTGFYFTPISIKDGKSLCLQLPTSVTKQGIVSVKQNIKYTDLMFDRSEHDELMRWVEQLEYRCQDLIDEKKELWFQTEITRDDIETMMTQITRLYKSGKHMLMRVLIDVNKTGSISKCIAYDKNQIGFDLETLEANKEIIPLIMIEGVKFSSRSFEIVLKLVQVMVLDETVVKKTNCLIKPVIEAAEPAPARAAALAPAPAKAPVPAPAKAPAPADTLKVVEESAPAPSPIIVKDPTNAAAAAAADTIKVAETSKIGITPLAESTLNPNNEKNANNNEIQEIIIEADNIHLEPITLRKPNEVYYEVYKKARDKAKKYRLLSLEAYLESKQIKTKYMLEDINDSDDDELFEQSINTIGENDN